jgi:hypothetical protein
MATNTMHESRLLVATRRRGTAARGA